MNTKILLGSVLVLGAGLACAAPSGKGKSKPKKNTKVEKKADVNSIDRNKENNTFDIALSVYKCSEKAELDDAARNKIYERSALLFRKFADDFPSAFRRTEALWMVAVCYQKLGNSQGVLDTLKELADLGLNKGQDAAKDPFIATAAYQMAVRYVRNAVSNNNDARYLQDAYKYFEVSVSHSSKSVEIYDAKYRMAAILVTLWKSKTKSGADASDECKKAYEIYDDLTADASAAHLPAQTWREVHFYYAQFLVESNGDLSKASGRYEKYIELTSATPAGEDKDAAAKQKLMTAHMQVARIALKLNDKQKAITHFKEANVDIPELKCEIIMALYQADCPGEILSMYSGECSAKEMNFLKTIADPELSGQCASILGYVNMVNNGDHDVAVGYFELAEDKFYKAGYMPKAAEAGYLRIVCLQKINKSSQNTSTAYDTTLKEYLERYSEQADVDVKYIDIVRVTYADQLLKSDAEVGTAKEYYKKVSLNNLPEETKLDAAYKKAWCFYHEWKKQAQKSVDAALQSALDDFISMASAPSANVDVERIATIRCMRAIYYSECHNHDKSIEDFEVVINNYKDSSSYAAALQGAAYAYISKSETDKDKTENKAKEYFQMLVDYAEAQNGQSGGGKAGVSKFATADAYFRLGCFCFSEDPSQAAEYFKKAEKDNSDYAALVALNLVKCQYLLIKTNKEQNVAAAKIKFITALEKLSRENEKQYKTLKSSPEGDSAESSQKMILLDAALWCFDAASDQVKSSDTDQKDNQSYYKLSVTFYRDALCSADEKGMLRIDEKSRPADLLGMALACLELGDTTSVDIGLQAIDLYLGIQKEPYDLANAKLVKSKLLNAKGSNIEKNDPENAKLAYEEAAKLCDEALNLGVNGPIVSKLRLVAGDAAYLKGDYERAAQLYGLVANFDRSDDLNREALYKADCAMRKNANRVAEADNYRLRLKNKLEDMGKANLHPLHGLPPSVRRHVIRQD